MRIERINEIKNKTIETIRDEGFNAFVSKASNFISYRYKKRNKNVLHEFKDVLFINGCFLPHPQRYRVDHQIEQLEAYGISCSKVNYDVVSYDLVKYFRAIVVYRCPITKDIEYIIKKAKENNKIVFYDIDDLVFDLGYTNQIKYLDTISEEQKKIYNDGVMRMGETLKLCDYGIASTKRLKIEMEKYLKDVYINRNVASEEMIYWSQQALKKVEKTSDKVIIGYLSGTITHNDDFKLIMPILIKLLKEYDNLYLKVVGLLEIPDEMLCVKNKIINAPFSSWRKLPELIRSIDINLAPLEDSIFNEAKSENKWTEAGLVKIPTVASNVGAFSDSIKNGIDGFLCDDENDWYNCLKKLIESEELRKKIGNNAYDEVMNNHVTINSGKGIANYIWTKLNKNVCFVLPSTNVSGGIMVAMKHASILKKNGYDVTLINAQPDDTDVKNEDGELFVIPATKTIFDAHVDIMVATMWLTLDFVRKYDKCNKKKYLVQGMETQFYKYNQPERLAANATYNKQYNIEYITISKWCENWLKEKFDLEAKYAPNGIDLNIFEKKERKNSKKIKILIEGNSKDYYKNVDESFKIVDELDKDKYEIHYLSYEKEPKKTYYYDKFFHKIPHEEVGKIYQDCDILIKTSLLESFSYPPLEMMATGGVCLAIQNCGNEEYLKDEYNCLIYEQGDIKSAIEKIQRLANDKKLRQKLIKNGQETAKSREWKTIEKNILELYE